MIYFFEKKLNNMLGTFHIDFERKILDINGNIVKSKKQIAHSLTGNFLNALYGQFANANTVNFVPSTFNGASGNNQDVKTSTGIQAPSGGSSTMNINGSATSPMGIAVGSGNTATTALDYNFASFINVGNGAGQLYYSAQQAFQAPIAVGNTTSFILQRLFQNNSGGTITVTEAGIWFLVGPNLFLICRDVFAGDSILAGQSYTIQYTFNVTT